MSIGTGSALVVDTFGVFSDKASAKVAYDFKNLVIIVHGVLEVEGRIVKLFGVGVVAFFKFDNLPHERVIQMMSEIGIVSIEICHICQVYLEFFL